MAHELPDKLSTQEPSSPHIPRRSVLKGALLAAGGAALTAPDALRAFAEPPSPLVARTEPAAESIHDLPALEEEGAGLPFSAEFLGNKVFHDSALSFAATPTINPERKTLNTIPTISPNGDVSFRTFAPGATSVVLRFGLVRAGELALAKGADGSFTGTLPFDEKHTGPMNIDVVLDGAVVLDPALPLAWSGFRPHNQLEIPDHANNFMLVREVAHGAMCREIYWSDALKSWERCFVYTPPGHMKSQSSYPVLYLQHGATENETTWDFTGHVAYILDNLIAAGKAVPFLVVMNDAMVRFRDTPNGQVDLAFEQSLLGSCVPHIEKTYRVRADKWSRSIAGLSMGAYMSSDIAFRHPEVFGSIGTFTASMTHESMQMTYPRPYTAVMQDAKAFQRNYRVYFRSTTPAEDHMDYFFADDRLVQSGGIENVPGYHRVVYPPRTTKWNSWRMGLRDYAQLIFRQGTRPQK